MRLRSLCLVLLLANLVALAAQFSVVRRALLGDERIARPPQLAAERLRILRDAPARATAPPASAQNPPGASARQRDE